MRWLLDSDFRVTIGYLRATIGHMLVNIGHLTVSFLFFFQANLRQNATELHPKVRPTCLHLWMNIVKNRLQVCSTLYSTTFNNSESYQAAPLTLGAVSTFGFLAFFLFPVLLPPSGLRFILYFIKNAKFHVSCFILITNWKMSQLYLDHWTDVLLSYGINIGLDTTL